MLPSLGFQEILLLGVLALVVIGPKDLPLMLRKLGRWTAKLRGMAQEFRSGFDELARQAELDELKKEVEALRRSTNLNSLANEITKPIMSALPTLEDYAGVATQAPADFTPASPPAAEAANEASGGDVQHAIAVEPPAAAVLTSRAPAPQSALRADGSPIEGEQAPEPLARSAP